MKHQIIKLTTNRLYKALRLCSENLVASLLPDKFTFPPLFKACAKLNSLIHGQILHVHLIKTGFSHDIYAATALTGMYVKLADFECALKVFYEMPDRNLASLNTMISGFGRNGHRKEALTVFKEMCFGLWRPNSVTIATVLPACQSLKLGMQVHSLAIKIGVELDVYVATSLLTMYSNFGEIVLAFNMFVKMTNKNVVSYNAFLSGLLQNGVPLMVLQVFKSMIESCQVGRPNCVTFISVISACASLFYLQFGKQVHGVLMKSETRFDTMVGTALVNMYCKCRTWQWGYDVFNEMKGSMNLITWNSMIAGLMLNNQSEMAVVLFEELEVEGMKQDSATWNSMIRGFSQLGKGVDALKYFEKMQSAGVKPSLKCMTSLLPACSVLSALKQGKEIHGLAIRMGISNEEFMATALIDMYMNCGYTYCARKICYQFESKPDDPAFWNAMICGYGRNGENESAFEIFDLMLKENVKPNSATFIAVLSSCSHTGQVDKGLRVFKMMGKDCDLSPNLEHFGCIVDLLGRCGKLEEAKELIRELPDSPASIFASLLGACRYHFNCELGEEMAMKLSELEPENPAPLVILSNIYAAVGRWGDVERIRQMIDDRGLRKFPGFSSISVT
ncbi:Pentatricopeptide repeat-containing protein [Hibiscus syriacus]|uniref:Pentatricopeptide repeat-containing protein n=1 Tax=Hibiscus syriacus TaxID=106335 RepID=A0A6A2YV80_HIBSY|nr:pentatricopeptide repeat-containing protein At2g02750 [Hibiscus syriacus]KAE8682975.1 Pentatricopeptide repeat-containing protein [Hibiscus syriacus]